MSLFSNLAAATGRKGAELQQPHPCLLLPADLHRRHHHAVLPHERLLQQGQPGCRLQRHHLLHPLPAAHPLLRLAGPHHQEHEAGCSTWGGKNKTKTKLNKLLAARPQFLSVDSTVHIVSQCFNRACCLKWPLASGRSTCRATKSRVWVCSGTTSEPARWRRTPSLSSPPSSWWPLTPSYMPSWPGTWIMSSQVRLSDFNIVLATQVNSTNILSQMNFPQDSTASGDPFTFHFSLRTGKVLLRPAQKWIIKVRMDICRESRPVVTQIVGQVDQVDHVLM